MNRISHAAFLISLTVIIVFLCTAYARNSVWKDEIGLWDDAIRKSPLKYRPYTRLVRGYDQNGKFAEAIEAYKKALSLNIPFDTATEMHYNLGIDYYNVGQLDSAILEFRIAITFKPDYASAYNNLGNAYYDKGLSTAAIECYEKAVRVSPNYAFAYFNRGLAYYHINKLSPALADFRKACSLGSKKGCMAYDKYSAPSR